jgi:N-dimethylarginine dimethylaminohydrolase
MPDRQPWLLMCSPDFYAIEYEINPWMSRSRGANRARAMRQWHGLYQTLVELGAKISLVDPVPGLPDMVFTANAGMMFRKTFIASRFRPQVRAAEVPYFEKWFEAAGFQVHRLGADMFFEGAGDALFCGPQLFGGYRIRSDARSHQQVASLIGCEVLPLELVDPRFYHLDTCFCPLTPTSAIWFPDAFDFYGQQVIRQYVADLIEVTPDDAVRFGANAVVVGRTVIVPVGCTTLRRAVESRDFTVRELELDEFLKAGGSAKCLTLRIDGEEAAAWRFQPESLI